MEIWEERKVSFSRKLGINLNNLLSLLLVPLVQILIKCRLRGEHELTFKLEEQGSPAPGLRLALARGLLGTRAHSRRWASEVSHVYSCSPSLITAWAPPPARSAPESHRSMCVCVCVCVCVRACVCSDAHSCLNLCDPVDCSLPDSSVHGISQARIWSGLPFPSPGDLPHPGIEPASLTFPAFTRRFFTSEPHRKPDWEWWCERTWLAKKFVWIFPYDVGEVWTNVLANLIAL